MSEEYTLDSKYPGMKEKLSILFREFKVDDCDKFHIGCNFIFPVLFMNGNDFDKNLSLLLIKIKQEAYSAKDLIDSILRKDV
jgi:hypothetical protein